MLMFMKKNIIVIILICLLILGSVPFIINAYVVSSTKNQIVDINDIDSINDVDVIIVLGCRAYEYGPSMMLAERLNTGISIYNKIGTKLLLSGDHGTFEYDEVNAMRDYTLEKGINSKDIFMDHAGFSTYESIYRAKEIFLAKKIIIVTQEYHLYRSLYIANKLGLEAVGVSAPKIYSGQEMRDIREILARNKDFVKVMFKPEPTYLGETIPISGDGNVTVD